MKNSKKKYLTLAAMTAVMGCLASCGGSDGGNSSKITTVDIMLFNGTAGIDFMNKCTQRFQELHKNTSFEEGKTGINFKIRSAKGISFNTEMRTSGDDIFMYEGVPDIYSLSAQKFLLNLDDIVEPMKDKIEPDLLKRISGNDGSYYALPHYEWFPGVSYDKDLFDEKNLYFADPSVSIDDKEEYNGNYGKAYFIADKSVTKSVGPNGIRGDYDDGLPSSLEEFNILCDKMMSDFNISPLLLCGSGTYYSWYLPIAMWASLTGGDGMRNVYCNWTNQEVEVVTGYSDENIFRSDSGLKKPTTEKIVLNDENGYKMYNMANRYYSMAFFEMALKNEWIDKEQLANANGTPTEADNWFINGHNSKRYGMLWDGSYWCHEAAAEFATYDKVHASEKTSNVSPRHISFMPLPTQLTGQVEEGKGKKPTLMNVGNTVTFANSRVARNGKEKAVKEFLKFMYSNDELAAFSELTGLTAPIDYTYDASKLGNTYYDDLATYRKDADVIQCASDSPRFKKNYDSFYMSYGMTLNHFTAPDGTALTDAYLNAMQHYNCDAKYIFEQTNITKANWDKMKQ
ncbi:MAG TPA: hypothetical protein DCR94_04230 [Firmicutes bacterium]|nr:hypothetical protein [Bacillota bacterium]